MEKEELEREIHKIHDFCIRMEPFVEKVDKINKAVFNDGWGIASQVKIMWSIFCIIGAALVKLWISK